MKRLLLLFILSILLQNSQAQLNMELRASIGYNESANDIWGYADPNQREYALVGLRNGVSIIDVTDPDNPVDLGKATGPSSTWRDIKTWGSYAYVTNESSGGILIIDLSKLPTPITSDDWSYVEPEVPGDGTITSCHNIFIDEFGFAYLTGCDVNSGGPVFFDVNTNPGELIYTGKTPAIYAHDVYAKSNKLYTSDIYAGEFSIYDVSNKSAPQFLGAQGTPASFTHNLWLSDDETVAFTTDEVANAPVGSYDVSDPTNIIELDQFRPLETLGDGVIPHNTHTWNDYLIISYYSDGCIIVDASVPDHLIEVGNFDTYIPANQGFNGAWGAYPYLPSGTVLVSDIGSGLYILTPTYKRAARLLGTVRDSLTGQPLSGVEVIIDANQTNFTFSDFQGKYKTGIAEGGTYSVSFSRFGYETKVESVNLENGELVDRDTELVPLASISGIVRVESNGNPIPDAIIGFSNGTSEINVKTENDGTFSIGGFEPGNFEVLIGAWGYKYKILNIDIVNGSELIFELEEGYEDNFALDLGWEVTGNSGTGTWERGEPIGTSYQGNACNPDFDLSNDISDKCFVTGNGGGSAGTDDVDNGTTVLTTPPINLAGYQSPVLSFSYWWFTAGGDDNPNDDLSIVLNENGNEIEIVSYSVNSEWNQVSFDLKDYSNADGLLTISFITEDLGPGHLVEAAIDGFSIIDANPISYPDFTISTATGCVPFSLTLADPSDSTTTWLWTVSSGTNEITATGQITTIEITEAGIYSVDLQVTTASGSSFNVAQNNAIFANDIPALNNFTFSPDNGEVSFMNNATGATDFLWDFGDGTSSNLPNPVHIYADGEYFNVTLTVSNSCGSKTVTGEIFTGLISGVEDVNSESFLKYFPNPFQEQMTIQYDLSSLDGGSIRLMNINGQLIQELELIAEKGRLQLGSDLETGIYFLQVIDQQNAYSPTRIVKIVE